MSLSWKMRAKMCCTSITACYFGGSYSRTLFLLIDQNMRGAYRELIQRSRYCGARRELCFSVVAAVVPSHAEDLLFRKIVQDEHGPSVKNDDITRRQNAQY